MARIRSPAHAPAMDPAWQRCRWQRGRDFALEPKLTALAMRIFGAKRRYEKLMRSSLETCTMLGVVNIRARLSVRAARRNGQA